MPQNGFALKPHNKTMTQNKQFISILEERKKNSFRGISFPATDILVIFPLIFTFIRRQLRACLFIYYANNVLV